MKVNNVNPVLFKNEQLITKPQKETEGFYQIKELQHVTPDYAVRTPQKYIKLEEKELGNGLRVHSYKLANGYRVSIVPMEGSPTTVKNYVNVGALNETDNIKGISHFLEHMAFNGTTGEQGYMKLNPGDSFKKIDKLGGWVNASTDYSLTDYVNSTPQLEEKDLEEQIKLIAAMTEDLALTPEMIEKEKGPVCSEIDMIMDDSQTILNDQTVRTLFGLKSSADELIGGSIAHIKKLTKDDVKAYYDKYYTPDNMNLVITGDVDPQKTIEIVAKNFHSTQRSNLKRYDTPLYPIKKTVRKDFLSDKVKSTGIMMAFVGPNNNNLKERIIFDILTKHIRSTDVGLGKELDKINSYVSLSKDKISANANNPTMLSLYSSCSDENSEKALRILYDKVSTLKAPTDDRLSKIKKSMLMDFSDLLEQSFFVNSAIGTNIFNQTENYISDYKNNLESITSKDIQMFIDKYFDVNKAAITLVHPKVSLETINENYNAAAKLSFKGNKKPINEDKIGEKVLSNNIKLAYHKTKNDNIDFRISYKYPLKPNLKLGVKEVFDEMLYYGTLYQDKDSLDKEKEEHNMSISASAGAQFLNVIGYSSINEFEKAVNKSKELLYTPRITQEILDKAVMNIKDNLKNAQTSSFSVYADYESKINPFYNSRQELLENLDSVTLDDIREFHDYIMKNSHATVVINIPEKHPDFINKATQEFEKLEKVSSYKDNTAQVYKPNPSPVVLMAGKSTAQADIMQMYKFPLSKTPKDLVVCRLINSLLSSSSIGLFDNLREKENLAYSVGTDFDSVGNCGEFLCYILTTTDNKDTGEVSYENVEKSINGFHRQINALIDSEYTDADLESAKRILKANFLNYEGNVAKLSSLNIGLDFADDIKLDNKIFAEIDNVTREDIDNYAKKIFQNPPVYSIVASNDTLEANKDFLESLK